MTGSLDPWRTLGLAPGASLDEVRRAYRRLAKANHPDAAGAGALPRFLAIQSAYEAIAGPKLGRRLGSRPGAAAAREPWRADPDRARASGTADGRRRPPQGSRPTGASADPAAGMRGPAQPGPERPGRAAGEDVASDGRSKAGRAGQHRGSEPGTTRRPSGRRRPSNRATPGSTSYDAADEEPFEPGWTGATWYGASSGTYWTINPKEYADPRKHGPEYQRRARRSASGRWIIDDEPGTEAPAAGGGEGESSGSERQTDRTAAAPGEDEARRSSAWDRRDSASRPRRASSSPAASARPAHRMDGAAARATSGATTAGRNPGDRVSAPGLEAARGGGGPPRDGPARLSDDGLAAPLHRASTTALGRLGLALLGWPPLGVAAATAIGESTGCGRFAASCSEVFSPGTWIVQIAIVLLLLALPRLAMWSAVGTLVALAAAIPTAVVLSAGGGSRQPDASAGVLLAVLGLAYVAGVACAIARRAWPFDRGRRVPWRR